MTITGRIRNPGPGLEQAQACINLLALLVSDLSFAASVVSSNNSFLEHINKTESICLFHFSRK